MVMGSGDPTELLIPGSGNDGSYYYDSQYSMFYNPANIADMKNFAAIEKSNSPSAGAMATLVKDLGTIRAGITLGRYWNTHLISIGAAATRTAEVFSGMNVDGVGKFGLGISWARSVNPVDTTVDNDNITATIVKLRLGAKVGMFEPFGHFNLIGKQVADNPIEALRQEYKHRDMALGTRVLWNNFKFIGGYGRYTRVTVAPTDTPSQTVDVLGLGAMHQVDVESVGRLYYGTGYWRVTSVDRDIVPLNVALEIEPLTWLTLRGGFEYWLVHVYKGVSASSNSNGKIGFTMKHNQFAFDWMVGNNASRYSSASAALEGTDDGNSQVFGFDSGFFTAAALRAEW